MSNLTTKNSDGRINILWARNGEFIIRSHRTKQTIPSKKKNVTHNRKCVVTTPMGERKDGRESKLRILYMIVGEQAFVTEIIRQTTRTYGKRILYNFPSTDNDNTRGDSHSTLIGLSCAIFTGKAQSSSKWIVIIRHELSSSHTRCRSTGSPATIESAIGGGGGGLPLE